jgi:Xaa-Pro aminopeptidase
VTTEYEQRRARLFERMGEAGVDAVFLPVSADLEYLTGFRRRTAATFGNIEYAHNWVTGCFLAPGRAPAFVLPRMVTAFDATRRPDGELTTVSESDDAEALFEKVARSFGTVRRLAVGPRTWADTVLRLGAIYDGAELSISEPLVNPLRRVKHAAELEKMTRACQIVADVQALVTPQVVAGANELEIARDVDHAMALAGSSTPSFDTGVWSMGALNEHDADVRLRLSGDVLRPGSGVSFDFGAVVDGYCSDFGRTVHVGDPSDEYVRVYDTVMAAQAAGISAVRPGVAASAVHAACRAVIVEAGLGDWFRHRTGHCIGLDVHEHPFISEEDDTPLEAGMTFTIEPSVFRPGHYGVRVEDVVLCEAGGGRKLVDYSVALVANR